MMGGSKISIFFCEFSISVNWFCCDRVLAHICIVLMRALRRVCLCLLYVIFDGNLCTIHTTREYWNISTYTHAPTQMIETACSNTNTTTNKKPCFAKNWWPFSLSSLLCGIDSVCSLGVCSRKTLEFHSSSKK